MANLEITKYLNNFVKEVRSNETLTGFIENFAAKSNFLTGSPENYFYVTSLCNPMDEFIRKKLPPQEETIEAKKRKNMGNKLHWKASLVFQKMEGF